MGKRNYNVFYNTHTVSGIVISVALYIIFFAGAFSLFKDEIKIWEEGNRYRQDNIEEIDFDALLKTLDNEYNLIGRDVQLTFSELDDNINFYLSAIKDSTQIVDSNKSEYGSIDVHKLEIKTYEESYDLGEFLYRLHFFSQIPYIGAYLAGLVSFFFLFAIVTGVIVHWKKIIPNFYYFNPRAALKRVWSDAHTALGIIGLPFQFIFAVSGAYFCLSLFVLLPAGILYNLDQERLLNDMRPSLISYKWTEKSDKKVPSFNAVIKKADRKWDNFQLTRGYINNYGGENMKYTFIGELLTKTRFIGAGTVSYDPYKGIVVNEKNPHVLSYVEDSQYVFGRLHFGNYGGLALRIVYFLSALLTCFVILSGILIWIESRNKKSMLLSQRLYTAKVGHIFLAICLTMFPVTAIAFIFVKLSSGYFADKMSALYWFYFTSWLVFTLYFRFKRDNYFTNKSTLLLGAIFGALVPIVNGLITGNWMWVSYATHQQSIFLVDMMWILLSVFAFIAYFRITPSLKAQSSFTKNPIDYRKINLQKKEIQNQVSTVHQSYPSNFNNINEIPMRIKIIFLWLFLAIGWIVHHIYGLFNIYYNEKLVMEGATGEAPLDHHLYRIIFEGICLLFALATLEVSKHWFKVISLIWASLSALFNIYHLVTAIIYESSNVSEIFILLLTAIASVLLVITLNKWRKDDNL